MSVVMQGYSVLAKSQLAEVNPSVLTAILSLAFTTTTHAQKLIFGDSRAVNLPPSFFWCTARYKAEDRVIMDSRQCMQLIPCE
jgi:hypothetical protein